MEIVEKNYTSIPKTMNLKKLIQFKTILKLKSGAIKKYFNQY